MERVTRPLALALMLIAAAPSQTRAYSVLAHEANIDALWEPAIRPLLQRRFARATREELRAARAFAYGGSVVQDLGYYPFGSHFFSNVLHYVRTGDFVETIIHDAKDLDEYAFALGTLAHYTADNVGHPEAVNKAVALLFPKLRAKYGDRVTYVDSPASHVIVEFSFDIVQIAAGAYLPEKYHSFIGFEVAKPLLERAFRETYGLDMKDVFGDEDLAMSTYRHSVSEIIPELTRVAWRDKREEIEWLMPGVKESAFIYSYTRQQYEKDFGRGYRKPGLLARFIGFIYKLMPKIGPLKPLSFKAPTPEAETLFAESFKDTRARYQTALDQVARGRLDFTNTNFDVGRPTTHGEYSLADDTYAELVHRLCDAKASVPPALRADIMRYYDRDADRAHNINEKEQKRAEKVRRQLSSLP